MPFVTLCDVSELTPERGKYVEIDGFKLGVFLHGETVHVIDDYCPHAGASLAGGVIVDGCAVCPKHQWAFHLSNGQLRGSPGVEVRIYKTRIVPHEGRSLVQADLPMY